jgi:NAD(P)-dependent dehydrogenase (short-subunit alcohol dehydrogenase family)
MKLEGAVVVVTGASKGIGRAIAEEMGHNGAKVAVNYFHSQEPAEELVAKLRQSGGEAIAIQADVADQAQATRLIEETVQWFGRIDVLVNNAGINIDRSLKNLSGEDWNKVIQTDLYGSFYTIKAAYPYFSVQKSGAIINISSQTAYTGVVCQISVRFCRSITALGQIKCACLLCRAQTILDPLADANGRWKKTGAMKSTHHSSGM